MQKEHPPASLYIVCITLRQPNNCSVEKKEGKKKKEEEKRKEKEKKKEKRKEIERFEKNAPSFVDSLEHA